MSKTIDIPLGPSAQAALDNMQTKWKEALEDRNRHAEELARAQAAFDMAELILDIRQDDLDRGVVND